MLRCPHCRATVTHADLFSRRLMRPRTCRSCGGDYFEGGTTGGAALVAFGGALATSAKSAQIAPWVPLSMAFGAAALAVLYMHLRQPRKAEELRPSVMAALVTVPVVAAVTWKALETFG